MTPDQATKIFPKMNNSEATELKISEQPIHIIVGKMANRKELSKYDLSESTKFPPFKMMYEKAQDEQDANTDDCKKDPEFADSPIVEKMVMEDSKNLWEKLTVRKVQY